MKNSCFVDVTVSTAGLDNVNAIDRFEQLRYGWPVGRIPAPVREKHIAMPVDQEIAPALVNIIFAIVPRAHPFPKQLEIESYRGRGKHVKQGQLSQTEGPISRPIRIGKHGNRPGVMLLIGPQFFRFGKRNDDDASAAPVKFTFA
jgi:hypothetical protein